MKKILFFVFVFTTLAFTIGGTSILIKPSSKLFIKGKTNINSFDCQFDFLKLKNPIPVFFQKINNKIVFDETKLVMESACFDCGGKVINKDFQKLLKSELYPEISIQLKEIYTDNLNQKSIEVLTNISVAGITKPYRIPVKLQGKETLFISGSLNLHISDFNLEAPKKALGLIVVKNTIEINFNLIVKEY